MIKRKYLSLSDTNYFANDHKSTYHSPFIHFLKSPFDVIFFLIQPLDYPLIPAILADTAHVILSSHHCTKHHKQEQQYSSQ